MEPETEIAVVSSCQEDETEASENLPLVLFDLNGRWQEAP
jgi:hypothetical protein